VPAAAACALVTVEAHLRRLAGRAMHTHIRHALQPVLTLLIEVGVVQEGAAVDEIAADVAHRALDLALRLGAIGTARARREAPMRGKAQELKIVNERSTFEPQVARDHGLHLIEEQLLRHAAEIAERVLKPADERTHVLARVEPTPEQA
jgi:hypothetical protein